MTLSALIILVIVIALVWLFIWLLIDSGYNKTKLLATGIVISILLVSATILYFNTTASGTRALKTQQSNFDGGINRTVKVYDYTGNLITEYEGKIDVSFENNRVLFDDENNKRHVIYNGIVIVDEK